MIQTPVIRAAYLFFRGELSVLVAVALALDSE